MTDEQRPERVEVTQADRDAAALLYDRISWPSWNSATDAHTASAQFMIDGKGDGSPFVRAFARHRLTALAEAASPDVARAGVPDGWKLVPVEPIEAMIREAERAGWDAANCMPAMGAYQTAWFAMLAAAPTPPAQETVAADAMREAPASVVKRAGGWFVTGEEWSGPWASEDAASFALDGEYVFAHDAHRAALSTTGGEA